MHLVLEQKYPSYRHVVYPVVEQKYPAGQVMHDVAPPVEYLPEGQEPVHIEEVEPPLP